MKKLVSILLVLVLALACSASAFADGDPITLKFWHHRGSGAQYECVTHAVNGFNETVGKEKGIVIEESYIGGYVDLFSQIQLAVQSGEAPNIVSAANTYVAYMLEDDYLVDMAPLAEAEGYDITGNLMDWLLQIGGNTDGQIHSLPYCRSTPLFYYNKGIAKELGIEIGDMITIDELKKFGEAAMVKNDAGEITRYGFEVLGDFGFVNAAWLWELGEPMLSTEGTSPALDGTSMLNMLTLWRKWVDEGICRPKDSANASSTASAMLVQGKLCSYMASSGSMKNLLKSMEEAGYELGVVYQPSFDPSKRTCEVGGGQLTLMAPGNDEKTLAAGWEFLQFLMSDEQVFNNSMATGYLPITKSVANYDKMQAFWAENPTYKVPFDQMMNYGVCQEYPSFPDLQEFIANIEAACSYLIQEQSITPEQAVQQMKDSNAHLF